MHEDLEVEFGTYSEWLVEAMTHLEPTQLIPAACRGTGRPELFERIADALHIRADSVVLDLGSGLGGPAAWLMSDRGCRVIGTDLMEAEVRASARIFPGFRGVVGAGERLPWADGSFDAAWILGVIELVSDRKQVMAEIGRVLKARSRVAIYGFFATDSPFTHGPTANRFGSPQELMRELEEGGVQIVSAAPVIPGPPPAGWRAAIESVRSEVNRRHAGDARLTLVQAQITNFNGLRTSDRITDWLIVGEKGAQ